MAVFTTCRAGWRASVPSLSRTCHASTESCTARCEPLLKWLRLAAGAYIRLQPETYEAIAVAMGDHASLDGWCAAEVETMGIEADEPQVCTTSAQFGANSAQFRAIL